MTIEEAKKISIREFLESMGIRPAISKPAYGMYLSPLREEQTASFKVDYHSNLWYDHGIGKGGSIIDLIMMMRNCDFHSAMLFLDDQEYGSMRWDPPADPIPQKSNISIINTGILKAPALISYLQNRGIDLEIVKLYCKEVQYRMNDNPSMFYAIGFMNDAGGWELRSPNFKCCNTPKTITTFQNGSDTVVAFEGFMDFLSYLTLNKKSNKISDNVILNSVTNLQKAVAFLRRHKTIHAFFDNDEAGRKATAQLRQFLPDKEIVDKSDFYREYKDLNDYLKVQKATSFHEKNKVKPNFRRKL